MKKRYLLPIFVLMPLTACSLSNINQVRAITRTENNVVKIGDIIQVEPRTLVHEQESKVVQGQIILPDGTSQAGRSFEVKMPGVYQVLYRAFFGVEEVSESIYYHCYRESGDLFVSSNPSNKAVNGVFSYSDKNHKIQGAKLKLDANTVFTYDGVIDFNTFDPEESFIRFIVDTSKQGFSDIETFVVRLTDVDDSSNYVDLQVSDSGLENSEGQGCYVLAGSSYQVKTGYEAYNPARKDDPDYLPHFSTWGSNVATSFRALATDYNPDRTGEFYFDYNNKALYAFPMYHQWNKNLITDLDDSKVYGSMIWEGFSSGKATISIFASSLTSASANIIITKIAGYDLSQLVFEDHDAPKINIDFENQNPNNLPKATINRPYKIFNASVSDNFDRDLPYEVNVSYIDQVNDKVKDISVIDGEFTPKQTGTYEISYHARDYSNNHTTETIRVIATSDSQAMSISFDNPTISQNIYTDFVLPTGNQIHVNGGSGVATITRRVEDSNHQEIVVEGDTFVPTKVGTYYAKYTAVDYIGNVAEGVVTLQANDPGQPIFVGDVNLPRVLIKGFTYTLPDYPGVEVVNNETVQVTPKIYIDGIKIDGNTFVANGSYGYTQVEYKLEGQSGTTSYSKSLQVVDTGDPLDQSKYFVGNFTATEAKDYVELRTNANASSLFASILAYDNPSFKFALENKTLGQLDLKFSDSKNPNYSVTFHITFEGDKTYISIGNSEDKYEFASEDDTYGFTYELSFENSSRILTDIAQTELTKIKYFDNGESFTGFRNGLYLDISVSNVTSASSIKVLRISNQNIGYKSDHKDHAKPIILLNGDFFTEQDYGEMAYVPTAEAFDVLSEISSFTISVRSPKSGYIIRDLDARVPQTFELNDFGNYMVVYKATDTAGNSTTYSRTIRVYDIVAPEITFSNTPKSTYSLNASVSIPKYTVTDNQDDYTVNVFLILPNDEERLLLVDENGDVTSFLEKDNPIYNDSFKVNSTTFRAEQYGQYILRFVVFDSDFNKTVVEFTFVVK